MPMPEREPIAIHACYLVLNGADAGRVGTVVDVLLMEELFGGWRGWFLEKMRIRPHRRWQATWLVLRFPEGDEGAYRLSDVQVRNG